MDIKDVVQNVEDQLAPGKLTTQFNVANLGDLQSCFGNLRRISQQSWMAEAACIGIAHERIGNKRGVISGLAKTFECHRSRISRSSKIYNQIIKPRIEKFGSEAEFLIEERSYYEVACDASERLGTPALELIEVAEENKLNNPSYSLRRFRDDLNKDGKQDDEGAAKLLRDFAKKWGEVSFTHDDVIYEFAEACDNPQGWLEINERIRRLQLLVASRLQARLDNEVPSPEEASSPQDCPQENA